MISLGEPQAAQDYLVKAKFDEGGYHVMLTDSCAVWEENIDSNKIQERLNVCILILYSDSVAVVTPIVHRHN